MDSARAIAFRLGKGWCGRPTSSTNTVMKATLFCRPKLSDFRPSSTEVLIELFSDKQPKYMFDLSHGLAKKRRSSVCSVIPNNVIIFEDIPGKLTLPQGSDPSDFVSQGKLGDVVLMSPRDKLDFGILLSNSEYNHYVVGQVLLGWRGLHILNNNDMSVNSDIEIVSENGIPRASPEKQSVDPESHPSHGCMTSFDNSEFQLETNRYKDKLRWRDINRP
eukprot:TRINITY_DN4490_c0_g1_i1.p1 TRINITY_DN4490_c0_g1~~TRINITY_DN4490_c0_g1_i1.p1  ORF type:complete len:243 (+),score=23.09 TRINITY_DN4490_c0_g1_i1:75-731(+)